MELVYVIIGLVVAYTFLWYKATKEILGLRGFIPSRKGIKLFWEYTTWRLLKR